MKTFSNGYLYDTSLTHQLLITMRTIGEFRGRQRLYAVQSPEVLATLRQVAMIQSAESSNRIEGITVAAERLAPLINRKVKPHDRSEQEVAGYRDVLAEIHANHQRLTVTPTLIRDWHRKMYRFTNEPGGDWKTKDNAIIEIDGNGRQRVRFQPVSAAATPKYIDQLIAAYHTAIEARKTDPLLLIASFIFDFECIHPFGDGNGRIGRLLTLLLLYQNGYEVGRYISLERIVEESKESYYEALHRSSQGWFDQEHDVRPWWNYFLGMLTAAYKEFEARVGTITSAHGAKREMVRNAIRGIHGRFTFAELQKTCPGISTPTLKRALQDMKREKRLVCYGKGPRAQWEHRPG